MMDPDAPSAAHPEPVPGGESAAAKKKRKKKKKKKKANAAAEGDMAGSGAVPTSATNQAAEGSEEEDDAPDSKGSGVGSHAATRPALKLTPALRADVAPTDDDRDEPMVELLTTPSQAELDKRFEKELASRVPRKMVALSIDDPTHDRNGGSRAEPPEAQLLPTPSAKEVDNIFSRELGHAAADKSPKPRKAIAPLSLAASAAPPQDEPEVPRLLTPSAQQVDSIFARELASQCEEPAAAPPRVRPSLRIASPSDRKGETAEPDVALLATPSAKEVDSIFARELATQSNDRAPPGRRTPPPLSVAPAGERGAPGPSGAAPEPLPTPSRREVEERLARELERLDSSGGGPGGGSAVATPPSARPVSAPSHRPGKPLSAPPSAHPVAPDEVPRPGVTHAYTTLVFGADYPDGVDVAARESYLADDEFEAVLGMPKELFYGMKRWRQIEAKKAVGLF
ncbi:unnamed protein product [Pedinophyceae sp. YPF-701]|nr:unnamed protein product [Pedinophyceae sp. YPF-701]